MIAKEPINVRELVLESSTFGPEEIKRIASALLNDQVSDVRQAMLDLQSRVEGGDAAKRNLIALGITAYLLARHRTADEYLCQVQGDGLASYYHARVFLALERYQDAADKFEQAAKQGFDPVQSKLERAGAIRMSGGVDEAEQLLRSTAREGATRAEYSYQMGCILADRGDTFGAIEYFERAVDMDPYHARALFSLAGQNNLLGNDEDAIKLYERCLSRPPMHLGALLNLGLLYEDNENYPAAAFCFRRILETHPGHPRAQLYLKDIEASGDMYYDEDALRRQRELDQILEVPITDFELSARSRNCLERAGIFTLGDLTRATEQDLLAGKNFGETSLQEIREILEARGLKIGQAVQPGKPQPVSTGPAALQREDLSPQERLMLETPVSELNLSVRARKCISRLGITAVGELVSRSADELLSVRNFGVTSLNEIRSKLAERGLTLRND